MTMDEVINVLSLQEEILQFNHLQMRMHGS